MKVPGIFSAKQRTAVQRAPISRSNIRVTRKDRKLSGSAFPERRKTNKFRETHFGK